MVREPHRPSAYTPCTPSIPCKDEVREGSVQSNHPRGSRVCRRPHPHTLVNMWVERFGIVDPPQTHVRNLYTPCFLCTARHLYLCNDVVREGSRYISNHIIAELAKYSQGCSVPIHVFRVVQPQQTSSNILEPLQCRESKVCRDLLHEFGVVRLYRTISNHIVTRVYGTYTLVPGGSTAATFLNHFSAEKARCVEVSHVSSG